MQLRALMRFALAMVLTSIISMQPASAQLAPLDAQERAELAAIPLTVSELPSGYQLHSESFISPDQSPFEGISTETLTDAGFRGMYVSTYKIPGDAGSIRTYASLWADAGSAQAGFELVEDESVTDPGAAMQDEPLEAGDGPAELTTGFIEAEGGTLQVIDATFTVDRFIAGVAIESLPDNAPDSDAIGSLVSSLEERANTVINGESPAGSDLSLPSSILDLRPIGEEIQAGFLSSPESEALYGVSGSSLGGIRTSWVTLVAAGEDATAPYVVVAVSSFENSDNAARVVDQADDIVPISIELKPVDGFSVDGVDTVRAFQYASPLGSTDGNPDSFRSVAQIGEQVIVIDVQGAGSVDDAQGTVTSLLTAQLQCSPGACELPEINIGT
jgi:hypothetical protein